MDKLWLNKSETQKVVETIEGITKIYNDYFSEISKEFLGIDIGENEEKDVNNQNSDDNEKEQEDKFLGIENLINFNRTLGSYNKMFDGLFKNMKASFFLNFFNYTININNVFVQAKRSSIVPDFQIDILKNMYLNNSIDYIIDFLMHNTIEDFKSNDGSINDELVDLILNNVTKLTKTTYRNFPDVYQEILAKVIPGEFIISLLTYADNRTELEKVVDMFIHLSTTNYSDLSVPLIDDPFFGILNSIFPGKKKEDTIVDTLAHAIKGFDISGLSKVKAAGIIINRASDLYEEQKNFANSFLNQIVESIPSKEDEIEKDVDIEDKEAGINENTKVKEKQGKAKNKDENKPETDKNGKKGKKVKTEKKVKDENIDTKPEDEDDLISSVAKQILDGEWVNFDLIESELFKLWK